MVEIFCPPPQRGEGSVPTADFNVFVNTRQVLINHSCVFQWSIMIRSIHPFYRCMLPSKQTSSVSYSPLDLYQTAFKLPLEISHTESIIGISTSVSSSEFFKLMNLHYHCIYSPPVTSEPSASSLVFVRLSINLLFSLLSLLSPAFTGRLSAVQAGR